MKLVSILAVCTVLVLSTSAYYIDPYVEEILNEENENALDKVQSVKRAQIDLPCMTWGMPCLPDSTYRFAQCCSDKLICACNVWKSSCRCRSSILG